MNPPVAAAAFSDTFEAKVVIALIGALVGRGLKVIWDYWQLARRWKRLSPYIVRQIAISASGCSTAFDTQALPRLATKLSATQASATELVAAGIETNKWLSALEQIVNCLDYIQAAQTASADEQVRALGELRGAGERLAKWVDDVGRK